MLVMARFYAWEGGFAFLLISINSSGRQYTQILFGIVGKVATIYELAE